jgi:hypothetical protein
VARIYFSGGFRMGGLLRTALNKADLSRMAHRRLTKILFGKKLVQPLVIDPIGPTVVVWYRGETAFTRVERRVAE